MRSLVPTALVALTLAGCGPKTPLDLREVQSVEGQVIWKNKPLEGAVLVFYLALK
jgi:hypothetical protein